MMLELAAGAALQPAGRAACSSVQSRARKPLPRRSREASSVRSAASPAFAEPRGRPASGAGVGAGGRLLDLPGLLRSITGGGESDVPVAATQPKQWQGIRQTGKCGTVDTRPAPAPARGTTTGLASVLRSITGSWDSGDEQEGMGATPPVPQPRALQQPGERGLPALLRSITGSRDDDEPAAAAAAFSGRPILACAGGGIFFFWKLGVVKHLSEKFDLSRVDLVGASAGGLVCTLAACGVDADTAVKAAYRIAMENGVFGRPGGLAGIWGRLVRMWLDELLPPNAAELARGRVRLVVTEVPSLRLTYLSDFETREDLIDANMCACHIPFFLDGNATREFKGTSYIDGSLFDFFTGKNSDLLELGGRSCIVDYFDDDQLVWSRLDFLKFSSYQEVLKLVRAGVAYAQRRDAAGAYERQLGGVHKGALRRAVELPVRVVANAVRGAVV